MKAKLPIFFTVGQLKELIADFSDDLPIGTIGHFGEFDPMDASDFRLGKANPIPEGKFSWRHTLPEKIDVLCVTTPDIGPEPD